MVSFVAFRPSGKDASTATAPAVLSSTRASFCVIPPDLRGQLARTALVPPPPVLRPPSAAGHPEADTLADPVDERVADHADQRKDDDNRKHIGNPEGVVVHDDQVPEPDFGSEEL